MGKMPNKPAEVNIETLMMENHNMEQIELGLKENLPKIFAGLTI